VFVIEFAIVVLSGNELCNRIHLDPEISAGGVSLGRVSLKRVDDDNDDRTREEDCGLITERRREGEIPGQRRIEVDDNSYSTGRCEEHNSRRLRA
jgi:hypothetical protein